MLYLVEIEVGDSGRLEMELLGERIAQAHHQAAFHLLANAIGVNDPAVILVYSIRFTLIARGGGGGEGAHHPIRPTLEWPCHKTLTPGFAARGSLADEASQRLVEAVMIFLSHEDRS